MNNKRYIEIPRIRIPIGLPNLRGNWRAWLPGRGNVLFTLLVIGALFWVQSAGAFPSTAPAAPSTSTGTIAYQGRLADAGGAPLTGTYSMIFRIYNAATGSVPLWTEQWTGPNSVQVSDGLFNVMLGSMTAISQTMITGNNNLWLGITVGTDDEMLPRVQLGSVPFAVQALIVPDASITTAKIATGAITTTHLSNGAVTQTQAPTLLLAPNLNARVEWGYGHAGDTISFSRPFVDPPILLTTAVDTNPGFRIVATVQDVTTTSFKLNVEYDDGGIAVEAAYWAAFGK